MGLRKKIRQISELEEKKMIGNGLLKVNYWPGGGLLDRISGREVRPGGPNPDPV